MPERFLLQVLRNLVNHGLLKSTRGVEGGYFLLRPPGEISLLHIIEATDGPLTPMLPPLDGIPEASRTKLQQLLREITTNVCRSLTSMTLEELRTVGDGKKMVTSVQ